MKFAQHLRGRAARGAAACLAAALVLMSVPVCGAETSEPDAERAYKYLVQVCRLGPRISGTPGMTRQQQLISKHFAEFDCDVKFQPFDAQHPLTGLPVRMNNMIVSFDPEAERRILLCCHYDTRPLPDRDPNPVNRRQGVFLGANDGASGVALYMELAHHLKQVKTGYGVDIVFFDGEELIYGDRGDYFLGSTYFAENYRDHPPKHRYDQGVLVDMIGDRSLRIYAEKNSLKLAPEVTRSVWRAARDAGVTEFIARTKHEVRDDHLPLNEIAKIPTCDIIDFDYPHWHTTKDVPNNCSGESLAKVARVLIHWLNTTGEPQDDATK